MLNECRTLILPVSAYILEKKKKIKTFVQVKGCEEHTHRAGSLNKGPNT